ncbi:MAG TPA: hypothetical protein VF817_00595 [Patescibacteria group bacterium]
MKTSSIFLAMALVFSLMMAGCGSERAAVQSESLKTASSFSKALELQGADTTVVSALSLSDGTRIIAANTNGSNLKRSALLVKLDAQGNVLWSKKISHQGTTETTVSHARLAPDGTIFLAGCVVEIVQENSLSIKTKGAIWICQVGQNGSIIKDLVLRNADSAVANETATDVAFAGTDVVLVGDADWDLGWQRHDRDLIAIRLDKDWQPVWSKRYGSFDYEAAVSCAISSTRLYISSSVRDNSWTYFDSSLIAVDAATGEAVAGRSYSAKPASLFANDMVVGDDGSLTLAGYCSRSGPRQAVIWKVDSNLQTGWKSFFGYHGTDIKQIAISSSGYVAVGYVNAEKPGNYDPIGMIAEIGSNGKPIRGAKIAIGSENAFSALSIQDRDAFLAGNSSLDASPAYFHNLLALQGDLFKSPIATPIQFAEVSAAITESTTVTKPSAISLSELNLAVEIVDASLEVRGL